MSPYSDDSKEGLRLSKAVKRLEKATDTSHYRDNVPFKDALSATAEALVFESYDSLEKVMESEEDVQEAKIQLEAARELLTP